MCTTYILHNRPSKSSQRQQGTQGRVTDAQERRGNVRAAVLNKRRGVVSSAATGNGNGNSYSYQQPQQQQYSKGNSGSYHTPAAHHDNDFGYAKFDNAGFSSAPQFNSGLGVTSTKKKRSSNSYVSGGFTDGSGNGYQQQQQVQSRDQRRLSRSSQQDDRQQQVQQQQQKQPRKAPRSAVKQAPHKQLAKQKQRRLRNAQA
jgi:hypothetical protein